MRLFGAVVMIAGMVWMLVGCSSVLSPLMGGAGQAGAVSGLVLADSVTQTRYNLSVADGVLTVSGIADPGTAASATASGAELLDGATGDNYLLGLTGGALTLQPGEGSQAGTAQIGLSDTVTAKTYELAVVSGALTLTPNEAK